MLLAIIQLFLHLHLYAGQDIGNGGDLVICSQSSKNQFKGYLSLDFVLQSSPYHQNDFITYTNSELYAKHIHATMKTICPSIASDLSVFHQNLKNQTNLLAPYLWQQSHYGLVNIPDENITRQLPTNCLDNKGKPNIIQAIIRKQVSKNTVIFDYDKPIVDELEKKSPLQYSFLITHEFLWNYTFDVNAIRQLNHLLHSKPLHYYSKKELQTIIGNYLDSNICRVNK